MEPEFGVEWDDLPVAQIIEQMFDTDNYVILRTMLKKKLKVEGLWWIQPDNHYKFTSKKHLQYQPDPHLWMERRRTTATFSEGMLFLRFYGEFVDIEGQIVTLTETKLKHNKKSKMKTVREYHTVTVTREYFENYIDTEIDSLEDICRHIHQGVDYDTEDMDS